MQREFARHGLKATCVPAPAEHAPAPTSDVVDLNPTDGHQLLFVGRLDHLKGGSYLLDALPRVASMLGCPIKVTFAGDGPERASWQTATTRLTARERRLRVEFTGWLDRDRIDALFARADLLVVPSVWPEPFGLVGLEAARHRLPVAAFAVGGIPDWLRPGVNGFLAPGDPPSPGGLADAIVACLKDRDTHAHLRAGAARVAAEFDCEHHLDELMRVLNDAACVARDARSRQPSVQYS
jgi:glycosyltransferase involved in cell wall biosynthesis